MSGQAVDVPTTRLPWMLEREEDREGRYLYVDEPAEGSIPMGITSVYTKYLSSADARLMAAALLAAADRNDIYEPKPVTPSTRAFATSGYLSAARNFTIHAAQHGCVLWDEA